MQVPIRPLHTDIVIDIICWASRDALYKNAINIYKFINVTEDFFP